MEFPKSKILTTQQLVRLIIESNLYGERFCFILGAGASVESGIPSGNSLEMRWMDCIMGKTNDNETNAMDVELMRECAANLFKEKLIEHSFEELETAWKEAKKNGKSIPSTYYFDIYKLRFYPNPRNGYRYLEHIMEKCEPSVGYQTLALMLTKDNRNNLVITTNFDNLIEDALFLYTDKKPLIVSHESLTDFIESDIQRPIIAKVHRGLMYAPFNSTETTRKLKNEWREALIYALSTYTPIVIGYGGGDHSLMSFLSEKTTKMRHGVYWCYRECSGLPGDNIQDLVSKNNGFFIEIDGFDALMLEIGTKLFKEEIKPTYIEDYLKKQYEKRVNKYNTQWEKLRENQDLNKVIQPINKAEQLEEKKREKEGKLTVWDYIRRGNRAYHDNYCENAIKDYTKAIELDSNNKHAYCLRGQTYDKLRKYEESIEDYTKAIELDQEDADSYFGRGLAYCELEKYEEAIEDYTKTIELDPNNRHAYSLMGHTYARLMKYEEAIEDFTKVIELNPKDARNYFWRGHSYDELGKYEEAIEDYTKAIELNPKNVDSYFGRGLAYCELEKYEEAIEDYTKAIELGPKDADAYYNRALAYEKLNKYEKAIKDYTKIIELNPNDADVYYYLALAYYKLNKYVKAIEYYTKAIELESKFKEAYLGRANAYQAIGKNTLAENDEKIAEKL